MAISLNKTVLGTPYTFHILVILDPTMMDNDSIYVRSYVYEDEDHFNEHFYPIIMRTEIVYADSSGSFPYMESSGSIDVSAMTLYAEQYLIDNIAWYSGGTIV